MLALLPFFAISFYADFGNVEYFNIPKDRVTGKSKGFGYVKVMIAHAISRYGLNETESIQLNPALTAFGGPIIFFCFRRTSVIANQGSKRCGGGSVRAGFNCNIFVRSLFLVACAKRNVQLNPELKNYFCIVKF